MRHCLPGPAFLLQIHAVQNIYEIVDDLTSTPTVEVIIMSKTMNLNVRVGGALSEYLATAIGDQGDYDNASEYVRDLIRRDKALSEQAAFAAKRAALQQAFSLPDSAYENVSAADIKRRALSKS